MDNTEQRKMSREAARMERAAMIERARGFCEVCHYLCVFTGNLHHIKPVRRGGGGQPDNLIFLCPNCHAVVHKIMSFRRKRSRKSSALNDWLFAMYKSDEVALLKGLGHCRVEKIDGKWQPIYREDVEWPNPIAPVRF